MSFHTMGLHPDLLSSLEAIGFVEPTPVQRAVIPAILKGRDIFATSKTGSGKSAAFLLPLLSSLLRHRDESLFLHVKALIVVPTRELARQLLEHARTLAGDTPFRIEAVYGGVNIDPQVQMLRDGCELLIATTGRLNDLLKLKALVLSRVQTLVLDEADTMLDMGFLEEIKTIVDTLTARQQTLLFSATHSGKVKHFGEQILRNPLRIDVDEVGGAADQIDQKAYLVDSDRKLELLPFLIGTRNFEQVLVFTSTRAQADAIALELEASGLSSAVIHGEKTHGARARALEAFRENKVRVLVATDIAARGIDIEQLPCVINFDMPQSPEDYIHRIGRTGRAGAQGEAISLVSVDEDAMLLAIERLMRRRIPKEPFVGYERKVVHTKMVAKSKFDESKGRTKGAFGKRSSAKTTAKKKLTKRDFRYGPSQKEK
ncbi:MAG: DEAD/DEAH box helicase [Campylobacterales bacterium]|nr:DEAD/DEAH box helicase [Campylobacterales bacterium]